METLIWLLGYVLAAGICILVGRGMWRAWRRPRARVREAMQTPPVQVWANDQLERGPDGKPRVRRPLLIRPGQIVECDRVDQEDSRPLMHMRQDYVDFVHYAQAEAERIPQNYMDALSFLGDAYIYLLRRGQMDKDAADILDVARLSIMDAVHPLPLRRPRTLQASWANAMADQWRMGR